ncbi:MAG: hypothetical protein CR984_03320 [Proteobacteria bacterium]|nr:MAG: hypothetical protein CR984_03320 [Pseudomonadota bacterium]
MKNEDQEKGPLLEAKEAGTLAFDGKIELTSVENEKAVNLEVNNELSATVTLPKASYPDMPSNIDVKPIKLKLDKGSVIEILKGYSLKLVKGKFTATSAGKTLELKDNQCLQFSDADGDSIQSLVEYFEAGSCPAYPSKSYYDEVEIVPEPGEGQPEW